jgi:hypothetical protein
MQLGVWFSKFIRPAVPTDFFHEIFSNKGLMYLYIPGIYTIRSRLALLICKPWEALQRVFYCWPLATLLSGNIGPVVGVGYIRPFAPIFSPYFTQNYVVSKSLGANLWNRGILRSCYSENGLFLPEMGYWDTFLEAGRMHIPTGHNWHSLGKIILLAPDNSTQHSSRNHQTAIDKSLSSYPRRRLLPR